MTRFLAIAPLAIGLIMATAGCQKGPAEQAGEWIDDDACETRDTLSPPANPIEATGRKLDDLTTRGSAERAGEAVDDAANPPNP